MTNRLAITMKNFGHIISFACAKQLLEPMPGAATRVVLWKKTLAQVFSCEFCEISKNTFVTEHLWMTVSAMRLLFTCLKGSFMFKKIEEIIRTYKETREKADELFQSVYVEAVSLALEIEGREMVANAWTADKLA